jgi:hypothetical protein
MNRIGIVGCTSACSKDVTAGLEPALAGSLCSGEVHWFDLLLSDDPFVTIFSASHTVLRLVSNQWEQSYNDVRPTRYQRMRPAKRGHDRLPHLEAVVRHPVHMVWQRIEW